MGSPTTSSLTTPTATGDATEFAWLPRGSEMSERIAAYDWASTPLGCPSTWPDVLRSAVATCLTSRFPLLVLWGPELVKIYNDGYAEMVGPEKHPRALGQPVETIWPEIWDEIGPMFESVTTTGAATWSEHQALFIDRHGFTEECYFTFSYSPLYDDGRINGVLDISVETTREVVQTRRLACIADLNAVLPSAERATDVCVGAVRALGRHAADVVAVDALLNIDGTLVPVASSRRTPQSAAPLYALAADVLDGEPRTLGQTAVGHPARHRLCPLTDGRGEVIGALAITLHPQRPFDDGYEQFVDVIAQTVGNALDRAQRRSEMVGELQLVNETLQRAMLSPVRDTDTIAARYLPAANNLSVGGDWYDIVDIDEHRRALVVGDCVGHGLHAATAMGQLRSAARALLLEGCDPARMVSSLDTFATSIEGGACASLVCVMVDRERHELTYCRAGHPPPIVSSPEGDRWLDAVGGPVLGITSDAERSNSVESFQPGDVLLMFTDGLVERRGQPIDRQLVRLEELLASRRDHGVTEIANAVLLGLDTNAVDDDVVIVVKRLADE